MKTLKVYAVLSEEDGSCLAHLSFIKPDGEQSVMRLTGDSALMMDHISMFEAHCHGTTCASQTNEP